MFVVKVYYIISWLWVSIRYRYSSIHRLLIETPLITDGTSYGSIGNLRCLWSLNSEFLGRFVISALQLLQAVITDEFNSKMLMNIDECDEC